MQAPTNTEASLTYGKQQDKLYQPEAHQLQLGRCLDAYSVKPICKVANVSATGTQFIDSRGSICYLSFVNKGTTANPSYYMQIWNTTHAIWWRPEYGVEAPATLPDGSTSIPTVTSNTFWFWRPGSTTPTQGGVGYGAIYDGRNGYSMNVSIANILGPRNSVVNQTGTIRQIIPEKMVIVGTDGRNDARGTVEGFLRAYSLEAPTWGKHCGASPLRRRKH